MEMQDPNEPWYYLVWKYFLKVFNQSGELIVDWFQLKCTTIKSFPVKENNSLWEITTVILKSDKLIKYDIN